MIDWINQAVQDGARRRSACQELSISLRTLQRWPQGDEVREDARPSATPPPPRHKLTDEEQQQMLGICNDPKYASLPASQIVPRLADEGLYVAPESSFYPGT